MSRARPLLAVVYDDGAVSPGEIGVGLADVGDVVFLVPDTPHVVTMRPVLRRLGDVRPLTGVTERDVALVRGIAPDAILTFSELMISTTAELAAGMGLPGHDVETAQALTDKVHQRRVLRAAGVSDVRTFPLRSMADWPGALAEIGLPAVVKPVRGAASRHTHPLVDQEQAAGLLAEIFTELGPAPAGEPRLIVEEMLQGRPSLPFGDYASVESLCTSDGIIHLAVSGKLPLVPPFRESGRFWPSHLSEPERRAILELVSRALRALGVRHGLTHTELKLTPSGPRIIEVNGRLGGHVNGLARTACGVDLVQVAARHALGEHQDLPYLQPAQVHFQHNGLAPTRPCRLLAVHGATEVRRLPGICGYRTFTRIGASLPGGVRTHELDVIWGVADAPHAMVELLSTALSTLEYEFQFAGGVRRMLAAECGAWATSLTKGAL